ncbi:MAG: HlyD family efflux transporter periplasmic adaptor subunit [Polyangiales bacterium]
MSTSPSLFRREAVEHQRARGLKAELIVLDPAATAWGFGLLCVGMIAFGIFVAIGRLNEYASGPAFVQLDGRTMLTATNAGLVTSVAVKPGDRVKAGDELVRFHAQDEQAELAASSKQFDSQLAKLLLAPDDAVTREALVDLRSRRELAEERRARRVLRAPHDGLVGDVRVREGQLVEPGLRMIDLQGAATSATVTALLPGRYRPLLHAGDTLRFEADGFHALTHELTVQRVGEQIVGPAEAARFVGRDLADAFSISGPVVLVQASLPNTSFRHDGQRYEFSSGMFGKAETVVRNEPLAYAFVPSLKQWVSRVGTLAPQLWAALKQRVQHVVDR